VKFSGRLGRNVLALSAVSLLTDLSSEMIYPLLPVFLAGTLGASAMMIGLVEGIAESIAALLKFASGWWSDRVTRRKPLVLLGYALATVARPLVGFAQSAAHVLLVRVTDRVGKGIRTSPRDALIADSVAPGERGLAYGFHRAADHAGAVLGPAAAFLLLSQAGVQIRTVFLLAVIPGALAVVVLVFAVREKARTPVAGGRAGSGASLMPGRAGSVRGLGRRFWVAMSVIFVFTLGASADAFLLLRAFDLGVPTALLPVLWAMHQLVKSIVSAPAGSLSDRYGRMRVIIPGWSIYALVYLGFAFATSALHAWILFAIYGLYFGLAEGTEKALVADMVPAERRGAAFGAYNLAISAGALPASLIFGAIWDQWGAARAFQFGALVAAGATVLLSLLVRAPSPQQSA
jgi:MFS family permease